MKMHSTKKQITYAMFLLGAILILACFYSGGTEEVIGVIIGVVVTNFAISLINIITLWREDKNKIAEGDWKYDDFYNKKVKIHDIDTVIYYESCINSAKVTYQIIDVDDFIFDLDTIIKAHYFEILEAHKASFIANQIMIRLDNYSFDDENQIVKLYTSRTTFYNDLVTNRAMDYNIRNSISIRDIFESGRYLTDLDESKMSNHIGINGILFIDGKMILAGRGQNATISKNKVTSTVAMGLSVSELKGKEVDLVDLTRNVHLAKLASILMIDSDILRSFYDKGLLQIHFLGFGRLVYTGGKPQFYFAYTADRKLLKYISLGERANCSDEIDYNKSIWAVKDLSLIKENGYAVKLITDKNSVVKLEAEKSFFANYWHIQNQDRIAGIPKWIYEL